MMLQSLRKPARRYAGQLGLIGLVGVVAYNWRLWQHDKALAEDVRSKRTPVPRLAQTPKVSVLVAAWNEADTIDAHIRSFLALSYPDIELILCAGGTDGTFARACQYTCERVTVLEQHAGEGKQRALVRCLAHASGEIIYLTDADCIFEADALVRLLAALINEGEQVATGTSRPLDAQIGKLIPEYVWTSDVVASARQPTHIQGLLGRNAALTRRAIEQSGGFNFSAPTGTDYHLARRVIASGIHIRYIAESVIPSYYPETVGSYWRKQSRWMRNLLLYSWHYHAYHHLFDTLRSASIGAIMLALPIIGTLKPSGLCMLWTLLLSHAYCSKVRYAAFNQHLHRRSIPLRYVLGIFPLTLVEFVIWVTPVVQGCNSRSRKSW